jgi:hypothetical protein
MILDPFISGLVEIVLAFFWRNGLEDGCEGSVAKNRLKAERALTIFSETFDERFQMASF